jgi:hypothetical protein
LLVGADPGVADGSLIAGVPDVAIDIVEPLSGFVSDGANASIVRVLPQGVGVEAKELGRFSRWNEHARMLTFIILISTVKNHAESGGQIVN